MWELRMGDGGGRMVRTGVEIGQTKRLLQMYRPSGLPPSAREHAVSLEGDIRDGDMAGWRGGERRGGEEDSKGEKKASKQGRNEGSKEAKKQASQLTS